MKKPGRGGRPLGRLGRIATVVAFGGVAHLMAVRLGHVVLRRHANDITASCIETDCQPQYYVAVGVAFVLLPPVSYLVGWAAIIAAGWMVTRSLESRLVARLVVAMAVTSCAVVGYTIWLASLPAGNRLELWLGVLAVAPTATGAMVAACTSSGHRESAVVSGPRPPVG